MNMSLRECQGRTKVGHRCRSRPQKDSGWCWNHNPTIDRSRRILPKWGKRSEDGNELSRDTKDGLNQHVLTFGVSPLNALVYDPREQDRIPEDGAWVMIVRELPSIAGGIDEHVCPGRIFYAHQDGSTDKYGFAAAGTYKVKLNTKWGSVWIWPYEYALIPNTRISEMWGAGWVTFNPVNAEEST